MAKLTPGDIVRNTHGIIGLVMRNDDDGLLVAYPGHDELTIEQQENLQFLTKLDDLKITDY